MVEYFARLSDAISIPIMIQDAPVSGTVLTPALLARLAREVEQVAYFKIESTGAAAKLRELIRLSPTQCAPSSMHTPPGGATRPLRTTSAGCR